MGEVHRVFVVLDREFGDRVSDLARTGPVWIVDTPLNRIAVQKVAVHPSHGHSEGITTFKSDDACSSEDTLINELDTIDLHHGSYSADPPYTVLDVIGAVLSERLRTELSQFGFDDFQPTTEGFRASRPLPSKTASR